MTTKRQILSLYRPLLERHSDLALIQAKFGPLVVLKPIHHLIRGFRVQRTAYSDYPEYHWDVGFTFWHKASVYGVAGTNFVTPDIKTMYWSHPHHEAAFIDSIETEILPILRSVGTIQALASRTPGQPDVPAGRPGRLRGRCKGLSRNAGERPPAIALVG